MHKSGGSRRTPRRIQFLISILAEMNSKGARVKIAILDASRRNPFERRFRSVPAGLAPVVTPKNTAVMYAAAPSTVMRDGDGHFCTELLKAIRSPGKIEEVFNRALSNVSQASRASRRHGFPRRWSKNFLCVPGVHGGSAVDRQRTVCAERVPVRRADSAPEGPGRISSPGIPRDAIPILRVTGSRSWIHPGKEPITDADARSEYQSAERIGTRRAWEDFLAKYPSGRYSDLARDRLAKLDPARQRTDNDADARSEYQSAERTGTEGPGRISSPSTPPDVIPISPATGSRSWIPARQRTDI